MISFGLTVWFWALAILPVLILVYVRAERQSARKLRDFVSPRLLPSLVGNVDRTRRTIRFGCLVLAIALAILALAQPRWGYTYEDVKRRGLDLLIAVDTSRSMLSNDVPPNRLQRVKLAAQDLIDELKGDRVGLIAFAGRAFLQAPLTIDYDAAIESINDLDTKTIPEGGTNISEAISLATNTFGKSAMGNRALIIFTDGEELSGDAVKEAKKAAENGVRVFTIGVGTSQGSLIPVESEDGTVFVKDPKGQVVKSKLDEKRLEQVAQATGGLYLHLETPETMRQLYREGLSKLQAAEFDARTSRRPIERYEWPLAGAIAALIASLFINDRKPKRRMRRIRQLEAVAAILLIVPSMFASVPGMDAYQLQKYDEALRQFQNVLTEHPQNRATDKLQFDSGAAAYKLHDYDKALQAFSQSLLSPDRKLQSKGHYNLGNTLYERGETQKGDEKKLSDWTDALKHYLETLKIEPQNGEAKDNYEFVKKKIDELKSKPSPSPSPQQQKNEKQKQQQKKSNSDQEQKKDQQNQSGDDDKQQKDEQNQEQKRDGSGEQQPQKQQQQSRDRQNSGKGQDEKKNAQSSPSPGPDHQSSDQQKNEHGSGESPSPSPGSQAPSPSENAKGEGASPSPSENPKQGQTASPAPSGSPDTKRPGEIKGASEPDGKQNEQKEAMEAAEAEQRGEMTSQQAERLLQAMKDEEARVQLDERRPVRRVYNDW